MTEQVMQTLIVNPANAPHVQENLDNKEIAILRLLCSGASNADIGQSLYMSNTSVKRKLRSIFNKMNVQTRAQAAAEAVRQGIV